MLEADILTYLFLCLQQLEQSLGAKWCVYICFCEWMNEWTESAKY